jgi:protein-disulfide isomerase
MENKEITQNKEGEGEKGSGGALDRYRDFLTPGAILVAGSMVSLAILAAGGFTIPKEGLPSQAGEQRVVLSAELYREIAQAMDLDIREFDICVADRTYKDKVEADQTEGARLGVSGTPGTFVNERLVVGAVPQELVAAIEAELAEEDSESNTSIVNITDEDYVKGNVSAPVTIVEFSDFQCPFCQRFHPSVQQIVNEYGDQVKWVYKHFPLDQIHPQARPAAEAAECVAEQKGNEGFWEFTDTLFEIQAA